MPISRTPRLKFRNFYLQKITSYLATGYYSQIPNNAMILQIIRIKSHNSSKTTRTDSSFHETIGGKKYPILHYSRRRYTTSIIDSGFWCQACSACPRRWVGTVPSMRGSSTGQASERQPAFGIEPKPLLVSEQMTKTKCVEKIRVKK